jgi:succinoglycan biosynthesis protein ExoO
MDESVSVIIPTYNVAATIRRAIASALAQTRPPLEILCVDDCSTDGTRALLEELAAQDQRVRVWQQPHNQGPSAARNRAIEAASGDWIAILDGDDAWRPQRLEAMLAASQDADIVMDNLILHDLAAGVDTRIGHTPQWDRRRISLAEFFRNSRSGRFQYSILKPIIRRSFLEAGQLRYPQDQRYGEDLIFYAECLRQGARMLLLRDAYYVYSTRMGEVTGTLNPASQSRPDFAAIVSAIDGFLARHDGLDETTRSAARACRNNIHVGDKLNRARAAWRQGEVGRALGLLLDPRVPALALRLQLRARAVRRA